MFLIIAKSLCELTLIDVRLLCKSLAQNFFVSKISLILEVDRTIKYRVIYFGSNNLTAR